MKAGRKWQSRVSIVLAGVVMGYAARMIWPPKVENTAPLREFTEPLGGESIEDLPILPVEDGFELPLPYEFPSDDSSNSLQ